LLFADDPALSDGERRDSAAGEFAWICHPVARDGVARCTHNLRSSPPATA
jgi:hypothetical protein